VSTKSFWGGTRPCEGSASCVIEDSHGFNRVECQFIHCRNINESEDGPFETLEDAEASIQSESLKVYKHSGPYSAGFLQWSIYKLHRVITVKTIHPEPFLETSTHIVD